MFTGQYIGCKCDFGQLETQTNLLNSKVVDSIARNQELVSMNNFAYECNEFNIQHCLKERITDVASWRWVLGDLAKRLEEMIGILQYEHNAVRVVVQRIQTEINEISREGTRPGGLSPCLCDSVEDFIQQEHKFLKAQKKKFEQLIPELGKFSKKLQNTKRLIDKDILDKESAISVDENLGKHEEWLTKDAKKKKRRPSPLAKWERRCENLKKTGLDALCSAMVARQQIRGARTQLSVAAQAYGTRVDSALNRRLHANHAKMAELKWQRDEAVKDFNTLNEEVISLEQNLLETMDKERFVDTTLAERRLRPGGELVKDEIDRRLRTELARLRCTGKHFRDNLQRTTALQCNVTQIISDIDCNMADLAGVISLDEERINARGVNITTQETGTSAENMYQSNVAINGNSSPVATVNQGSSTMVNMAQVQYNDNQAPDCSCSVEPNRSLGVIQEEDENAEAFNDDDDDGLDDYPFDN